jgi:hypothetical protein
MTFKDIRDRIQNLLLFGGWTNTAIKPDYAYLANMGLKLFTQESQHCTETLDITTVANQQYYDVRTDPTDLRDWVALFDDAAYGFAAPVPPQLNVAWLPKTAINNLDNMDRLWRFTPAGTPQLWFWYDPQHLGLWPTPSNAGTPINWLGSRFEPPMVNDNDMPLVPDVDCEGIALLGAWYHGKLYARGDEIQTIQNYKDEGFAFADRTKEVMSARNADLFTRHVSRAPQEYMSAGSRQIPFFSISRG